MRPGLSFAAADLAGVLASKPKALSDGDKMPMVFLFRSPGAAEAVLAGALPRLAKSAWMRKSSGIST
jgi:hypothetical protein